MTQGATMTKMHFEAIAAILQECRAIKVERMEFYEGIDSVQDKLIELFERSNPLFDRKRFLAAVGDAIDHAEGVKPSPPLPRLGKKKQGE